MTSKIDTNWHQNFEALKSYILERGHLPDKHVVENRALLSWAKYQRKKIKEGSLDNEKQELFESLLAARSNEHTGGRRKKIEIPSIYGKEKDNLEKSPRQYLF